MKRCNAPYCYNLVKGCKYGYLRMNRNAKVPEFYCRCVKDCAKCKVEGEMLMHPPEVKDDV